MLIDSSIESDMSVRQRREKENKHHRGREHERRTSSNEPPLIKDTILDAFVEDLSKHVVNAIHMTFKSGQSVAKIRRQVQVVVIAGTMKQNVGEAK